MPEEPTGQLHQILPLVQRHIALIDQLRARAPRLSTARLLAERLGVTTHTIERDLTRLREAGVPLRVRSGPGGGYALDSRAQPPPITFSAGEVSVLVAAVVAVGPETSVTARETLDKLLAV
ncbi:helix-turn-helix transcriptional regulator [Nocardiopsis nanhaiensis]